MVSELMAVVSELMVREVMTDSCHGTGTALPLPASEHRAVDHPYGEISEWAMEDGKIKLWWQKLPVIWVCSFLFFHGIISPFIIIFLLVLELCVCVCVLEW